MRGGEAGKLRGRVEDIYDSYVNPFHRKKRVHL
jgi:hypothetical protein